MNAETKQARDPFTFSLRGVAGVNTHAFVPAVALDGINRAWRARRRSAQRSAVHAESSDAVRQVESALARYFAHGCCRAA